ncbi:hypothetical protein A3731_16405 [Roseovarius sp. HI0049]|nr:hypothetical protein A3731_16405 [Roseovarius sp. HI0049]
MKPVRLFLPTLLFCLAACIEIPSDPLGTTRNVEAAGTMKVGYVSGEADSRQAEMERFAARVAEAHGVGIDGRTGAEGALLRALEEAELDLVIGVFPQKSPWKKRVAFTSSVDRPEPGKTVPVLRGAVHNGENRWLLSIERVIERDSS